MQQSASMKFEYLDDKHKENKQGCRPEYKDSTACLGTTSLWCLFLLSSLSPRKPFKSSRIQLQEPPMKTTTYTTSHLLLHSQFYCGILDYVGAWVRLDLPPNTFKTHHPILDESLSYSLRAPMHVIFLSSQNRGVYGGNLQIFDWGLTYVMICVDRF